MEEEEREEQGGEGIGRGGGLVEWPGRKNLDGPRIFFEFHPKIWISFFALKGKN